MIPQETVDLILDTTRIEDVVGDFVTLKRRGANFVACCPFHNEKTPSFYVSPSKGIYKCFGCGKAGNAIGFIMEHEHSSYGEALRYLASKYHIEIQEKEETAEDIALRQRNESLMLVSDFAWKYFADQLKAGEGRTLGYSYYKSRGLEDETIGKFGLGWAPSGKTALIDAAQAAGYKLEYLIAAGLAVQREDGSVADKFHERVMFPIHTLSGRVIAFSGRTLRSDNPAKYVNSPETEIYIKSRNLLGIYFAKAEISRLDKCILVEGNLDMVMMHQLGITNVVASCGTSLTVEQIRLIHKFTDNVTIMYDGDSAGIHAALRGIGLVLKEGMNVKVVLLPDGEDPDSYSRKHSLDEVKDFIAQNEQDFIEFKAAFLADEAGKDPIRRANLINDIADTIALIPDAVKRSVYVETVSDKFSIESRILFERIGNTRKKLLEDERREAERSRRRAEQLPSAVPYEPADDSYGPEPESYPPVQDMPQAEVMEENHIVAQVEKELLQFILKYGTETLNFECDSEFYSGSENDKPAVADFIRSSLEADGSRFYNTIYRRTYDAYMEQYDEGYSQDSIIRTLLSSPDRVVADVTARLSMEEHQLSIKVYEDALTTTSSWLVTYVPKTLLVYVGKKIDLKLNELRRAMTVTPDSEEQLKLMAEINRYNKMSHSVKIRLGREKEQ